MMQKLQPLLRRYARRRPARWWAGARPDGREGQLPRLIAAQVDYPTSSEDPFADGGLVPLDLARASHVLALAGTESIAFGSFRPRPQAVREAREALLELAEGPATFLSNGIWGPPPTSWSALSSATFECGVIGFDASNAFIFWIEEED